MNTIRKLIRFIIPYRHWALLAPLMMMLEVAMDLMQPRMMARIVDQGIARLDLNLVLSSGGMMLLLALIGAVGGMGCGMFAEVAAQNFSADLRAFLFRKVQSYSFSNMDEMDSGQLITRLTNDVTQVQEALLMILRMMIRAPLLLAGSMIMSIITCPSLAFIPLILTPIELIAVVWVLRKATPLFSIVQGKLDALNGIMQENLAGVRVVKAFVRADHEIERFSAGNDALTQESVRAGRTVAVMPSFMMLTMNLGVAAALWFGGVSVTKGGMHPGQMIAFINYLITTLFSLIMVSQTVMMLARALASARRIAEVIDQEPGIQNKPDAKRSFTLNGRISFENVSFGYAGEPVLREVSFTAKPGETVALLGSTGAGKSSLVNLIPRFYEVSSGRVLLDGNDVRDLDQDTLRRNIGVVLQDSVLFSGTIRDNIRYGRAGASDDEVVSAAKAAQAHDFITAFPDGYDTLLGQRGVNVSGGQKQRIAIARALLIRPAILILDDSTSAVDVETESRIQDALNDIMKDRTCIVIAQRISTVLNADRILVIDDGRIIAQGKHRELMAASSVYHEIYDSQLGEGA